MTEDQAIDAAAAFRVNRDALASLKASLLEKSLKPHHPALLSTAVDWCARDWSLAARVHHRQLRVLCQELYRLPQTRNTASALGAVLIAEHTLKQWRAELELQGVVIDQEGAA